MEICLHFLSEPPFTLSKDSSLLPNSYLGTTYPHACLRGVARRSQANAQLTPAAVQPRIIYDVAAFLFRNMTTIQCWFSSGSEDIRPKDPKCLPNVFHRVWHIFPALLGDHRRSHSPSTCLSPYQTCSTHRVGLSRKTLPSFAHANCGQLNGARDVAQVQYNLQYLSIVRGPPSPGAEIYRKRYLHWEMLLLRFAESPLICLVVLSITPNPSVVLVLIMHILGRIIMLRKKYSRNRF